VSSIYTVLRSKSRSNIGSRFWDWALDWKNLTQAPVWDATQGFGGNGAVDSTVTVGHGRCVQDGPFAHLQLQYYNNDWRPHCLSRGFIPAELQEHFGAQRLNSSAMAAVMDEPDYYKFLMKLEEGPHSAIPITVRGDFSRFTAPNGKCLTHFLGYRADLCSL
jgi:tyrosinase